MRVLDAAEARAVDEAATRELGIPSLLLMENAAIAVADAIGRSFPACRAPLVLCGPGRNGADGIAVARHLAVRGYRPHVVRLGDGREPAGDIAVQLDIARRMDLSLEDLDREALAPGWLEKAAREADLLVDALFGTGLARPLEGSFLQIAERADRLEMPRVAVDLPSGLDASRGDVIGASIRADLTVAFAAPKRAHVLAPACERCGDLVVADLGAPARLVDELPGPGLYLTLRDELRALLPAAPRDAHKGTFGHLVVVGGSAGMRGAIVFSARGALRSGVGLVTVSAPSEVVSTVHGLVPEAMSAAWPAEGEFDWGTRDAVLAAAQGKQAAVLGPGLGRSAETRDAVMEAVLRLAVPLVLDADGLAPFAGAPRRLRERAAATVLTPHAGELARLLEMSAGEIEQDRLRWVRHAAAETGAVVVLKGRRSLVASSDGEVSVNPTGNPGLGTGGTGDVLAGMVGALLAQRCEPFAAAQLAVWVHGRAGDLAAERLGERSMVASDVVDELPEAWRELAEDDED